MTEDKITISIDSDLEDLIPGFLENRNADLEKLAEALAEKDLPSLQSIGHNLKGVGGGYGFEQMSELGAGIEVAAKAGEVDTIATLVEQLRDYLARIDIVYE